MNLLKAMFKNRDRRVSVIMFIFAIIWLYMSKDIKGIFNYAGDRDPGSRLFPIIIGVLLLVTSVGKFLTCTQEVYSFKILGYLLSTFVAGVLCVFLLKEDRKVRWYSPILFSAGLTGIMYLLFGELLSIVLPVGTIWKLF